MVEQVQIPHSVVEGKAPQPQDLAVAGLAVNLKDFTLYTKGYDGVVIRLTGVVADDTETDEMVSLTWAKPGGGARQYTSSSKLSFNPHTGALHAVSFNGSGAGLTGLTADQIEDALGFAPAEAVAASLPPPASDLASAIALANGLRAALINSGIGS